MVNLDLLSARPKEHVSKALIIRWLFTSILDDPLRPWRKKPVRTMHYVAIVGHLKEERNIGLSICADTYSSSNGRSIISILRGKP
jgi:hypothetical protein